jgi:hypothetical protein
MRVQMGAEIAHFRRCAARAVQQENQRRLGIVQEEKAAIVACNVLRLVVLEVLQKVRAQELAALPRRLRRFLERLVDLPDGAIDLSVPGHLIPAN